MTTRVYLVPGFFGFAALGDLHYFQHVKEALDRAFSRFGADVQVHRVDTLPTAAIARRAARLLEIMRETAGDAGPIHLVGHSTGALDARLLLDPEREQDLALTSRIKSVISVSGAHRGTPLASAFRTAFGKEILKLLALMTIRTLKLGPLPVAVITTLTSVLAALDSAVGAKPDFLDQLQQQLLDDLTSDKRLALHQLFEDVAADQALIDELTPELAQHFDAQTRDRPRVKYACIVTEARRPGVLSTIEHGLSPYAQASHALYHALYRLTARSSPSTTALPEGALASSAALSAALGNVPGPEDNDGIVPTLSQFHGTLLRAVQADHHDVIGHFDDAHSDPPHIDWLLTGTGFTRTHFEALWTDVAAFVLEAEHGTADIDEKALERLLRRSNKTLDAERAAVAAGRWAEYLAERVPPPSRLSFLQHAAWRGAHERAVGVGCSTSPREVVVIPVWYCENESDEPAHDWTKAAVASFDDGSFEIFEVGARAVLADAIVIADVEVARLGFLVRSRSYAPDVELLYRNRDYAALESRRIERILNVKRAYVGAPVSPPDRAAPPFSTAAVPAITLDDVDPAVASRVGAILEKLKIAPPYAA